MALVVEKTTGGREYKVNDLSLAYSGSLDIERSEVKMPGVTACRDEFDPYKPLKGARITASSGMTAQDAVFIQTLTALGAEVRCCSCNISSTEDHVAAAIARDSASVFAWKGQTLEEYWWCMERVLDWGAGGGPDLIVDGGGDVTLLIHEGVKAQELYEKTGELPDPSSTDNVELQIVLSNIREGLKNDPMRYRKMTERLVGVSEETTVGVERLYQMQADETLSFPAINVNDSVTKNKFSNLFGCGYAVHDGITRAANMKISEKKALVFGYDDASEGYAIALKQAGADVAVHEVDPNPALQALLGGFSVIKTLDDDVVSEADIFVTNINKGDIPLLDHLQKMKNNALIYGMDPILDLNSNIYTELQRKFPGMKIVVIDPQTDKWVFPDTNSSITVLRSRGNPSFMSSWPCTSHVVAMLELWSKRGTDKYENKVYVLSEHLEQKVSDLHLTKLTTTKKETKAHADDHVSFPNKSDKKRILLKGIQACSVIAMVALCVMQASRGWVPFFGTKFLSHVWVTFIGTMFLCFYLFLFQVGTCLLFPKVSLDLLFSGIWDN